MNRLDEEFLSALKISAGEEADVVRQLTAQQAHYWEAEAWRWRKTAYGVLLIAVVMVLMLAYIVAASAVK